MNKTLRAKVYNKYNGLCAYTGKPLDDRWQVDHVVSKRVCLLTNMPNLNHIDNLMPALYIVNHYKRALDLEGFRAYMMRFHIRLGNLPKKTKVASVARRTAYMNSVAYAFGITVDKPFSGKFYFEALGDL